MRLIAHDEHLGVALREIDLELRGESRLFNQVILGGTPGVDTDMRYGKPGLRTHINYIGRMITGSDMKLGRDAIKRYDVLRKELDTMRAQVDRVLGPGPARSGDR